MRAAKIISLMALKGWVRNIKFKYHLKKFGNLESFLIQYQSYFCETISTNALTNYRLASKFKVNDDSLTPLASLALYSLPAWLPLPWCNKYLLHHASTSTALMSTNRKLAM